MMTTGPIFTDLLPQDLVKTRRREIPDGTFPIALKLDNHLGSSAERYGQYNVQSRGFETPRHLSVTRLTAS